MKTLALTSGYFNPIHPGHIECFFLSKQQAGADELWVIVNNDVQARKKRGVESFQDENFRMQIVQNIKMVDRVFLSIDTDESVVESLRELIREAKDSGEYNQIIFTKGGDRFSQNIPELKILQDEGVKIVDGLGEKTFHSREIISRAQQLKVQDSQDYEDLEKKISVLPEQFREKTFQEIGNRPWGIYYVLEEGSLFKVKKIIVQSGKRLSLQSHKYRSEHWIVVSGVATVDIRSPESSDLEQKRVLLPNESIYIPKNFLHRLENTNSDPLVIIEVQCGEYTGEDDIIRYSDDFGRG